MKKGLISKILAGGLAAAMAFGVLPSTVLAKETPLHCMLKNRDGFSLEEFKAIFSEYPEWINEKDGNGGTLLSLAVEKGRLDVVKYLVEEDCVSTTWYNRNQVTLLHIAARNGHWPVLCYLADLDAFKRLYGEGFTPLHWAAFENYFELVHSLVTEMHADVNAVDCRGFTPFHQACCLRKRHEIVDFLKDKTENIDTVSSEDGRSPLYSASYDGDLSLVQYLVRRGADINRKDFCGCTPLYVAINNGQYDVARWLIDEAGADINCTDNYGDTLLHIAAHRNNLGFVKYLIENPKLNISYTDKEGSTPLHEAARHNSLDVLKWLIEEKKLDVNCRDNNGNTLLHMAVMGPSEYLELVKWLVEEQHLDVNSKNKEGETIMQIVVDRRYMHIARWLIEEKKLDVNCRDIGGNTLLHMAIKSQGSWDVLKWLVEEQHLDVNSKNEEGETPLDSLIDKRIMYSKEIFSERCGFLMSYGALPSKNVVA